MKKLLSILLTLALCIGLMPAMVFASSAEETPAAADNAVMLYADYGDGFEALASLYFEQAVSEQTIEIDQPVKTLRVVKGDCYELDLDRLTLNGVCPAGYERKLSATDNDLIEVEESMSFDLSGSGELVIAGRAPLDVMGEDCSFKFPQINRGPIFPGSFFYSYIPGSNPGSFTDGDALIVPDEAYLFESTMCYPDSGHPDAPMDIYVADDGETLYVFFEAFIDNTFDHGKDFAGVHVKSGDIVKTYKVHTTEENEYGRWWFGYTDSSDEYDWEHMCYVVEVPMADLDVSGDALDLAFEYYGTAGYQGKDLLALAVNGTFLAIDEPNSLYGYYNPAEYWPDAGRLPAPGTTLNSEGGDTKTGDWWVTNNGTAEESDYTLTLNGATLDTMSEQRRNNSSYTDKFAPLYTLGNVTVELAEGSTNVIKNEAEEYSIALEAQCSEFIIQGAGTLNISANWLPLSTNNNVTIRGCATVNAMVSRTHKESNWDDTIYYRAIDVFGLTVDDATLKATASVTVPSGGDDIVHACGIEIGSTMHKFTLKDGAIVESFATGGNNLGGNHAIYWYGDEMRLSIESSAAKSLEGDSENTAVEADNLTTQTVGYNTFSQPYVKLETEKKFSVAYDANGGSGEMPSERVTSGAAITLKANAFTPPSGKQFKTWNIEGAEYGAGENYTVFADTTVKANWEETTPTPSTGGGGGTTTYPVKPSSTENGNITVSPKDAAEGMTVTVTVTPDEGYELDKLIVKDKDGNEIEVTEKDGKYTFTMPAAAVDISATFRPDGNSTPDDGFPFVDVPEDAYFRKPVEWAVEKGITSGVSEDKYGPELSCTRAQVVTFLWITCGSEDAGTETGFDDVDVDAYYDKAVAWAVEKGITAGTSEDEFSPEMIITRAQFVTMLWVAQGKPEADCDMPFTDVPEDAYYAKAVAWAYANDITAGKSADSFAPDDPCTRGQIMTFLYNAYEE